MLIAILLLSTSAAAALAVGGAAALALYPLLPADLGGAPNLDRRARRVRIPLADGDELDGWHLAGTRASVVVVFHGFGRTHHRAWRYAAFLERQGHHVVTVDFRSSRWRDRKPTTLGHFEMDDARATLEWVRREPSLAGMSIGVLGESLGGAVALTLAAEAPDVRAVVADCAFASGRRAIEESCERWARLPAQPSASVLRSLGRAMTGKDPWALDPAGAAERLRDRPLFLIHGERDDRLSPAQAHELWRAAGAKDPLWIVPGVGHNEAWLAHRELYESRVGAFFARHLFGEGEGLAGGPL